MTTMGHHGLLLQAGSDPFWANVKSLLHFAGANGSTTFTDQKSRAWTPSGNARISTDQSKFGGSSYTPFSSSSSIQSSWASAITSMQDFTIEFFLYPTQVAAGKTIVDIRTSATNRGLLISQPGADPSSLNFYCGDSSSTAFEVSLNTGAASISAGNWYYLAACRNGNNYYLFLNGTLVASTSYSSLSIDYGTTLSVGNNVANSATVWFEGYIDEFRITAGIARYTSSFTQPSAEFPNF